MNRQDFRSFTRIEVRWAEVDAQKIVFNAHYLMYADVVSPTTGASWPFPMRPALHCSAASCL